MVSSKNMEVSQKRFLGTSIESFTSSSPSDVQESRSAGGRICENRGKGMVL